MGDFYIEDKKEDHIMVIEELLDDNKIYCLEIKNP